LRILEQSPGGISMVLDPTGTPMGPSLCREEGILYADIDLAQSVEPKQFHDVVGYYNRFDIFAFSVDRSARPPATFVEGGQGKDVSNRFAASWAAPEGARSSSDPAAARFKPTTRDHQSDSRDEPTGASPPVLPPFPAH
jgi:hypothetical protein